MSRTHGVPLTGVGLVTSVGRRWPAACAAIRAGISRPHPLTKTALDADTMEPLPIVGHPIRGITDGFTLTGCWLRLALACLADLRASHPLPGSEDAGFWERTRLLAALPPVASARFDNEGGDPELGRAALLVPLCKRAQLPFDDSRIALLPLGHVATAHAIRRATNLIESGRADRVLVLAVDSMLDAVTLDWLLAARRLKTEEVPAGLAPGEAAGCLLLEVEASARRRQAPVLATIATPSVAAGPKPLDGDRPDTGEALASCIRESLAGLGMARFEGDVVSDLNGETWRAMQWGGALSRLPRQVEARPLHLPATSVGDTGAASGALGIAYAAHLFARKAARTGEVLVLSSSDDGGVASAAVRGM